MSKEFGNVRGTRLVGACRLDGLINGIGRCRGAGMCDCKLGLLSVGVTEKM